LSKIKRWVSRPTGTATAAPGHRCHLGIDGQTPGDRADGSAIANLLEPSELRRRRLVGKSFAHRLLSSYSLEPVAENGGIGVRFGCHCSHLLVKRLHSISPFIERFQRLIVNSFPGWSCPGFCA
jgi:hypothetical protein